MMEYIYRHPVVNDPGDYYKFLPNHFAGIGFRFEKQVYFTHLTYFVEFFADFIKLPYL